MVDDRVNEELLRRLVAGHASPTERAAALAHVRTNEAAARVHRTLVEAERALAGGALDEPSAAELESLLPTVLPPVRSSSPWPRRLVVGLPALAAAAVLALVVTRGDDEGSVRSDASVALPLEVFCVDGAGPRPLALDAASCPVGAALVVALPSTRAGERVQLSFVDARATMHDVGSAAAPAQGPVPLALTLTHAMRGGGSLLARVGHAEAKRAIDVVDNGAR